jgi:hypothetical protein
LVATSLAVAARGHLRHLVVDHRQPPYRGHSVAIFFTQFFLFLFF